jgi:hypothetical protein
MSENRDSFLRLLKNKGFKEERMTKVELYAIGKSTPLESNKSLLEMVKLAPILEEVPKDICMSGHEGSGRYDGKLHATFALSPGG